MTQYDMDPDGVTRGVNRLRAAGESFGSAWAGHRSALDASRSGVGGDPLSQAFLQGYLPLAERLAARADAIAPAYSALCDDAMSCVAEYQAAEASGTGTIRRVADHPR
ncbi:hypothetical protein [Actinokineospora fastidiosa]|uniref:Uncharacterized protein n=1 Tax=Actinokineospora fastidiosa TaxID=1816 RepID=A0A918LCK9_9PSEU|nr:hypothetical protein [Actinokineospora fastidiosa]GGS30003.1 hypothetical protein GCM10010171_24260 [Actinokineospora fastidiosa]